MHNFALIKVIDLKKCNTATTMFLFQSIECHFCRCIFGETFQVYLMMISRIYSWLSWLENTVLFDLLKFSIKKTWGHPVPTALQQPQTGGQTEKFLAVDFQSVGLLLESISTRYLLLLPAHSIWKSQKKSHFNNASEASNVYILTGQKFIKIAKNGQIDEFFKTLSLRSNSVARQVNFKRRKLVINAKMKKVKNVTFWVIFNHCVTVSASARARKGWK